MYTKINLWITCGILLAVLSSCKNDDQPGEELGAHILLFNAAPEMGTITLESTELGGTFEVEPGEHSPYVAFSATKHRFTLSNGTGQVVHNFTLELIPDTFHTLVFFQNNNGDYRVLASDAFTEKIRTRGRNTGPSGSTPSLTYLNVYHVSLQMPLAIDLYDLNRNLNSGHTSLLEAKAVFMKSQGLSVGEMSEEFVETSNGGNWSTLATGTPRYVIWDATRPEFSSLNYRTFHDRSSSPPDFNADLPAAVPEESEHEVPVPDFSRERFNYSRGHTYAMILYDYVNQDVGYRVALIDLHVVPKADPSFVEGR